MLTNEIFPGEDVRYLDVSEGMERGGLKKIFAK
mgnify:CR=1 FL=1